MGNIKILLDKVNVPMGSFIIYTLYSIIMGFTIASSIAAFAFSGVYCFNLYLKSREKESLSDELSIKIKNLESNLQSVKLAQGMKTFERKSI